MNYRFSSEPRLEARMILGEELRKLREAEGLDLNTASRLAGLTSSCLNRIEHGKFSVPFDAISALCRVYKVHFTFI